MKADSTDLFAHQLIAWFRLNARDLPWRRLPYSRDAYAIMVSEFMLQQTQVATVVPYFERWMKRFPDMQTLASATEEDVLRHWQGLGYYSRARNLQRAVSMAMGQFPQTLAEMKQLPGMGDYTAGAVLTFAFDARVPIVDANIARVLARLFDWRESIDTTEGRKKIWSLAAQLLPKTNAGEYNAALMELGALVCTPRPQCDKCPVKEFCEAENPEFLPNKSPKAVITNKVERATFSRQEGRIAMVQRSKNPWQGMWVLPEKATMPGVLEMPIITHRYSITRYRVSLEIYEGNEAGEVKWFTAQEVENLPIPSPYRKVLEAL